jgi:diacylglycerol kinase (ATP)
MKHVFVINPAAGKQDSSQEVTEYLQTRNDIDWEIYRTTDSEDAIGYIKNWGAEHPNEKVRFYACGGDGTLNEVVCGAVGNPNASVTIYPCGSGNDYIKYYGGEEVFSDIGALIDAVDTEVDLMRVGDRYSINVTNFGFDTKVAQSMTKYRRTKFLSGKRAYFAGIVTALITGMKNQCTVYVDDEKISDGKNTSLHCFKRQICRRLI